MLWDSVTSKKKIITDFLEAGMDCPYRVKRENLREFVKKEILVCVCVKRPPLFSEGIRIITSIPVETLDLYEEYGHISLVNLESVWDIRSLCTSGRS